MRAIAAAHGPVDPSTQLMGLVTPYLSDIQGLVQPDDVLVALYVRPEKTAGGLVLPEAYREEDVYQGKVGLVLKMGPLAFKHDDTHVWPERTPAEGDWVVFRVGDAWPLVLGKVPCRIMREGAIRMIIARPDLVI